MKKRVISVALLIAMCLTGFTSYADEEPTLIPMHATAYCLPGKTASGEPVREGICATGHKDWIGKTVVLYQRLPNDEVGEIIAILEVKDTGCKESVIDVWKPNLDECQDFMDLIYTNNAHGKVWIQVIDAKG